MAKCAACGTYNSAVCCFNCGKDQVPHITLEQHDKELSRLRAEAERMRKGLIDTVNASQAVMERTIKLEIENKAMREWLKKYAVHVVGCAKRAGEPFYCTCALDDFLKAVRAV